MRLTGLGRFRTTTIAVTATVALAISGCSADVPPSAFGSGNSADDGGDNAADDGQQELEDMLDALSSAAGAEDLGNEDADDSADDGDDGNDGSNAVSGDVHPLTWHIPTDGVTPDGFQRYPAACEAQDPDSSEVLGSLTYAIPDTWLLNSRSPGGDLPVTDATEMTFRLDEGNSHKDYEIEFRPDNFEPDRSSTSGWALVDYNGEPWESFDTGSTHFDPVTTVTVADQQVEILAAPQDQAPEALKTTEYVARVQTAEVARLPGMKPGDEGTWTEFSSVISIRYDADSERAAPLTDDIVADIVASIAMPDCARDLTVARTESHVHADVNDDGHVTTEDEYLAMRFGGS